MEYPEELEHFMVQKKLVYAAEGSIPNGYEHNFVCASALNFEGLFNPLKDWIGLFDYVIGNPPYNVLNRLLFEGNCCFVVLAEYILKPKGQIRYVMPCSFTHIERWFREITMNIKRSDPAR